MRKLIVPIMALALFAFATEANAGVGLTIASRNLYNARMRAYNAKINYYQNASLYYLKKMPALTAKKYGYASYSTAKYSNSSVKYSSATYAAASKKVTTTYKKAVNATTTSQLMALLKGWGR